MCHIVTGLKFKQLRGKFGMNSPSIYGQLRVNQTSIFYHICKALLCSEIPFFLGKWISQPSRGQLCPWRAMQTLHFSSYQKPKETYRWKAEIALCFYNTLLKLWIKPCKNISYSLTQLETCTARGLKPWPDHGPAAQPAPQQYHSEENMLPPKGRESKKQLLHLPEEALSSSRKSNISQSICWSKRSHIIPMCTRFDTSIQTYFSKQTAKFPLSWMEARSKPQLSKSLSSTGFQNSNFSHTRPDFKGYCNCCWQKVAMHNPESSTQFLSKQIAWCRLQIPEPQTGPSKGRLKMVQKCFNNATSSSHSAKEASPVNIYPDEFHSWTIIPAVFLFNLHLFPSRKPHKATKQSSCT